MYPDPRDRTVRNPVSNKGEIMRSQMYTDWRTVPRGLVYPEPFQEADVVVIIGGWDGTHTRQVGRGWPTSQSCR